jgi:hypothetical protein
VHYSILKFFLEKKLRLGWIRTIDPLIKREGEVYFIQRHPIAIGMIVRELLNGCNGFPPVFTGAIGNSLHRPCTVNTLQKKTLNSEIFNSRKSKVFCNLASSTLDW